MSDTTSSGRRRYESPVRRQGMAATRERIVGAGIELVRGLESLDWSGLTVRAVADRAGVGVRTVYRHFPNERALHSAIMAGLASDAGVDYGEVTLANAAETAARVFRSFETLTTKRTVAQPLDPAFVEADRERRQALLRAVAAERPGLDEEARVRLAAVIDVLWGVPTFERLLDQWGLDPADATDVIAWAIERLADG